MTRSWDRIRPQLEAALDAAPYRPELVLADFPFDAPLMGALALAVEATETVRGDDGVTQNRHTREGLTL